MFLHNLYRKIGRASAIFIDRSQFPYSPIINIRQAPFMYDLRNTNNCCASNFISIRCGKSQCGCIISIITVIIPAFVISTFTMIEGHSVVWYKDEFDVIIRCCFYKECTLECVP